MKSHEQQQRDRSHTRRREWLSWPCGAHRPLLTGLMIGLAAIVQPVMAFAQYNVYFVDSTRGLDTEGALYGKSWDYPYKTIAFALSHAALSPGMDELRVAVGTYYAPADGLRLGDGMLVRGGYRALRFGDKFRYYHYPSWGLQTTQIIPDPDVAQTAAVLVAQNLGAFVDLEWVEICGSRNVGNDGGGLLVDRAAVCATNVRFIDNQASNGGGVCIQGQGLFHADHCLFLDNVATTYGGAIMDYGESGHAGYTYGFEASRCEFIENSGGTGGAIFARGTHASRQIVDNSTFSMNEAIKDGGAIAIHFGDRGAFGIYNCSFSRNVAGDRGGGVFRDNAIKPLVDVIILNTILWENQADQGSQIYLRGGQRKLVEYCMIQDIPSIYMYDGSGNWDSDPLFVDPDNHNLDLQIWSCAINNGSSVGLPPDMPDTDVDGDDRVQFQAWTPCGDSVGTIIDIGAHEVPTQ